MSNYKIWSKSIFTIWELIIIIPLQNVSSNQQSETQKQLDLQRLQQEHLKKQQELILQQQHNIQELQQQISSQYAAGKAGGPGGVLAGLPGPQQLMFLPFLEQLQLRGLQPGQLPQLPGAVGKGTNALPTHVSIHIINY